MKALPQAMATPNIHIGIIAGKLNGVMRRRGPMAAHRIDVDAGAGALRIFALQRVRDAAGIFDHFEAALDVAAGIGDHLAMLRREHQREILHVPLDQSLEVEHHPRPALRIGRRPGRQALRGGSHRRLQIGGAAQAHLRLDAAIIGVEDLALRSPDAISRAATK